MYLLCKVVQVSPVQVVNIPVVKQRPFPMVLLFSRPRDSAVALGQDGRCPCLAGLASSTGAGCDDDSHDLTVASR